MQTITEMPYDFVFDAPELSDTTVCSACGEIMEEGTERWYTHKILAQRRAGYTRVAMEQALALVGKQFTVNVYVNKLLGSRTAMAVGATVDHWIFCKGEPTVRVVTDVDLPGSFWPGCDVRMCRNALPFWMVRHSENDVIDLRLPVGEDVDEHELAERVKKWLDAETE